MRNWSAIVVVASAAVVACSDMPTGTDAPAGAAVPVAALSMARARSMAGDYIVVFHDSVADVSGQAQQLAASHGADLRFLYTSVVRGFAVSSMSAAAVEALQHNPRVAYIEPDQEITTSATITQLNPTWGLDRIDQRLLPRDNAYSYDATGAGVTVYVMDTGIRYTHVEFGGRARFGYDAFGGNGADCHGHGTHVAGTVGGTRYGVAKQVALVSVRVLDCNGSGSFSGFVAGADWIARNATAGRAVMNASLTGPATTTADNAIATLVQKGVVPVVAAGNNGASACNYSPARAPSAITVGATTSSDARPSYSNYGACVDWFAPGSGIVAASYGSDTGATTKSGTSMAAPHVAGAAALYLQLYPLTGPLLVRDALFAATTKGIVASSNSANNHLLHTRFSAVSAPAPVNAAPVASFAHACAGLACQFGDTSTDSDGSIARRSWSFGDGTTTLGSSPNRTYAAAGTYTVRLTVTDNVGATATTTHSVQVASATPSSIAIGALGYRSSGTLRVKLTWSGATSTSVNVFRNGVLKATTANDGSHIDSLGVAVGGSYAFHVCAAGTSICSNTISVVF